MKLSQLNFKPNMLSEYIGNEKTKEIIALAINAYESKNIMMNHTLITGDRGVGKTTLARIIANELNMSFKIISAESISKMLDLTNLFLVNLPYIIIIDEIHGIKGNISDSMHQAMDSFEYSYIDDDGLFQTEKLHPFCVIGMTTDPGLLTAPMYSRYPIKYHLLPYTSFNLQRIVMQAARINKIDINSEAALSISLRSFGIPRIALSHFSNVYEYSLKFNNGVINNTMALKCFDLHDIDEKGLDIVQIQILKTLSSSKKPMGAENICQSVKIGVEGLLKIYEPPLLSIGFTRRTSVGREITREGLKHLNNSKLLGVFKKR